MIAECISNTGKPYGDPQGYCFHHFTPYKCWRFSVATWFSDESLRGKCAGIFERRCAVVSLHDLTRAAASVRLRIAHQR
jgi:hypothetical protein